MIPKNMTGLNIRSFFNPGSIYSLNKSFTSKHHRVIKYSLHGIILFVYCQVCTYFWSCFLHVSFFDIISCDPRYELGEHKHTHNKVCLIQAWFSVLFLSKLITINFGSWGLGFF